MEATVSQRYTVPASAYIKAEVRKRLWRFWWLIAAVMLVPAIAGCYDSRYWYVLLMLLFIVQPMVLSFTWFALAAHKSMQWRLRPQETEVGQNGLIVRFYPYDDPDAAAVDVLEIPFDAIAALERQSGYLMVALTKPNKMNISFLLLPADIIPVGALDNIA